MENHDGEHDFLTFLMNGIYDLLAYVMIQR